MFLTVMVLNFKDLLHISADCKLNEMCFKKQKNKLVEANSTTDH